MKSRYIGVWLLLSVSLIVVAGISFLDDTSICGFELKKSTIAESLLKENRLPDVYAEVVDTIDSVPPVVIQEVVVDTLPQNIMIFGDSMLGGLAPRLAKYAKQNGHTLHSVIWDSSTTRLWAETDTLQHFIAEYKPTFIFISLGSNELYLRNPYKWKPYVDRILEKIGDIPYVWIGPPNWKEDSGINDMIAEATKPGTFFRSAGMKFDRKRDKIHPTTKSAALWMDSVARWMPKSAHPILMETPSDSIGKASAGIVYLKALNKM